jgi:hypothetical protein
MTNFLEQLVAEYYSHLGYFVKTNVKFGLRDRGGWEGEMDVVAYHPESLTLLHIETSMDADSWEQRYKRFKRKFSTAESYYREIFKFEIKKIKKMAIVGLGIPQQQPDLWKIVPVKYIPYLIQEITDHLSQYSPLTHAISENYPLLRAMQFAIHFDKKH